MKADDVAAIGARLRAREFSATEYVAATLAAIASRNPALNAFTAITTDRAHAAAAQVDAALARGENPGPLAGIPYAVKNLFDLAGMPTLAGSKLRRRSPPAMHDATLVQHMDAAGAILVGTLNMDEFAYGFVTENEHDGPTRNPHDLTRSAGGSSGGSAAAVAAGLVPLSLGSDTNGSIRIPAALCGVFGLKPTYGRLSRVGAFPFVPSLDHVGPFARNVADLAACYDALQGVDPADPAQSRRDIQPASATLRQSGPLRAAVLGGWFATGGADEVMAAVAHVARALNAAETVELPESDIARSAAFCITAVEGANQHLADLRTHAEEFDSATRARFLAGALLPAQYVIQAHRFRRWYRDAALDLLQRYDVLIAPTTPCSAPLIGEATMRINGIDVPVRPNLGLYTQPISFIGLPVVAVPASGAGLPIGVQLIGAPWNEALLLRAAWRLTA